VTEIKLTKTLVDRLAFLAKW